MRLFMGLGGGIAVGVIALATGAATVRAGMTIGNATGPGGHTYEIVADDASNWSAAKTAAEAKGGFLATIGDADEQTFVEGLLTSANAGNGAYWFGLHESNTEGDFRHLSGRAPMFTHWLPMQPDNFGGNEVAGSILWGGDNATVAARKGFWNDLPDTLGYPQVASVYSDLVVKGYVLEFPGSGPRFDNGDGDNTLAGPKPIPLPAAALVFPLGACLAAIAARRTWRKVIDER